MAAHELSPSPNGSMVDANSNSSTPRRSPRRSATPPDPQGGPSEVKIYRGRGHFQAGRSRGPGRKFRGGLTPGYFPPQPHPSYALYHYPMPMAGMPRFMPPHPRGHVPRPQAPPGRPPVPRAPVPQQGEDLVHNVRVQDIVELGARRATADVKNKKIQEIAEKVEVVEAQVGELEKDSFRGSEGDLLKSQVCEIFSILATLKEELASLKASQRDTICWQRSVDEAANKLSNRIKCMEVVLTAIKHKSDMAALVFYVMAFISFVLAILIPVYLV